MFILFLGKIAYPFTVLSHGIAFIISGIIILAFILVLKYKSKIAELASNIKNLDSLSTKQLTIMIILFSLVLKVIGIFAFNISLIEEGTDINVYVQTANELCSLHKVITYANYCFDNPHIFVFALLLTPCVALFGKSQIALSIYLSIIITVSLVLLFKVFGDSEKRNICFVSIIIYCLLPSSILMPQYITHEIMLFFFITLALYLYHWYTVKKNKLLFLGSCFMVALGCSVNQMGIIFVIALLILWWFINNELLLFEKIFQTICLCCIILSMSYFMNSFQLKISEITNRHKANSFQWVLFVGNNSETSGMWNSEDVYLWNDFDKNWSLEEITIYQNTLLKNRIDNLIKNNNFLKLWFNKTIICFTYFSYPLSHANQFMQSRLKRIYQMYLFKAFSLLEYGIQTLVLCYALSFKQSKISTYETLIKMFIIGGFLVLLVTEVSSKYTFGFQMFLLLALMMKNDGINDRIQIS